MKTNLSKKMTSLFLAIMLIMSVVPMIASAEVTGSEFWQTIVDTNMDVFTGEDSLATIGITSQTVTLENGKSITAEFVPDATTGYRNDNSRNHDVSIIKDPTNWMKIAKSESEGEMGDWVLRVNGAWVSTTKGTSRPDAGWKFSNLWDANAVSVGGKIRLTTTVYIQGNSLTMFEEGQKDPVASETWTEDNPRPTSGQMRLTVGDTAIMKDFVVGWNTFEVEIDITEDNIAGNSLKIDFGTPPCYHNNHWLVGHLKVEEFVTTSGSYTIADGKKWKDTADKTVKADIFSACEQISSNVKSFSYKATGADGEEYTLSLGRESTGGFDAASKVMAVTDKAALSPKPNIVGDYVLWYQNKWINNNHGEATPDQYIELSNIFDSDEVNPGDKIKVTLYAFPSITGTWPVGGEFTSDGGPVKMRLRIGDHEEYVNGKSGRWNEFTIIHEITEENKNDNSVKIDYGNSDTELTEHADYKGHIALGAVTVTSQEADSTEVAGTLTGTVRGIPAIAAADAANYRVLVGAYKNIDEVYVLVGARIFEIEADNQYDFTIENAADATGVKAFLWNINTLEPQIMPIDCRYITQ